jgi:aspartyl protease family protein
MRGHVFTMMVILGVIALGALAVWLLSLVTDIAAFDNRAPEMVFYISLLLLLMVGGLNAPRLGFKQTVRNILIWAAVFVVLVIGFSYRDELKGVWARVSGELSPGTVDVQGRSLSVRAGGDGHFYIDVGLNGAATTMLVDTGATSTVISQSTARRAGLDPSILNYTITLRTANGTVHVAPTRIGRLTIGPRTFTNARVLVTARKNDRLNVLGIETLRLFKSYQVTGNALTLRW